VTSSFQTTHTRTGTLTYSSLWWTFLQVRL